MAAEQQREDVMSSMHEHSVEDPGDDKPTMPAPARPRKDRTLVLSCLLLASCCTATLAQWMPLHASAEAMRPVRVTNGVRAAASVEQRTDVATPVLDVPTPAEAGANEPEPLVSDDPAAEAEPQTGKARESDALVRDANRLLHLQPALARTLFALAAVTDPRNPHAHAGLARALHKLGKPAEARDAIEQALRIRPKRASYRALLKTLNAAK